MTPTQASGSAHDRPPSGRTIMLCASPPFAVASCDQSFRASGGGIPRSPEETHCPGPSKSCQKQPEQLPLCVMQSLAIRLAFRGSGCMAVHAGAEQLDGGGVWAAAERHDAVKSCRSPAGCGHQDT